MKTTNLFAILFAALVAISSAQAVTISTVPIGNPANPADMRYVESFHPNGVGSVSYSFRIGETEISNVQYIQFLNAVAASDPYALYNSDMTSHARGGIVRSGSPGSYEYSVKPLATGQGPGGSDYEYANKPVSFVTWFDCLRFANWLHNGQGSGDTETGAYTIFGGTETPSNAETIARNPGATWWLPSEDEWYKAAYHKNDGITGNYWDYPTGTNAVPANNLPSSDTGNSANYNGATDGSIQHTDVGAYSLSSSPYSTFDQGGNVREWTDTRFATNIYTVMRGGYNSSPSSLLHASGYQLVAETTDNFGNMGFRVASNAAIPEPSALLLWFILLLHLCLLRYRTDKSKLVL